MRELSFVVLDKLTTNLIFGEPNPVTELQFFFFQFLNNFILDSY